eukprot:CAMPEP_0201482038 /NCGR_PEP_ID=MMETSP0151_2-20130828/6283_1 /ASSEMBLY_ACC=CAM_ASM_000257 /TAXON_ID=200890 /ORGANISM="Paramoeba atlantica, Strain 621/1 / CCAP 1560/9" /LENGTH=254 /DNA_ID=CAMNT_0047864505 /DNA_START=133 /DNA_END=897 /DNA_ORIENTATION=-
MGDEHSRALTGRDEEEKLSNEHVILKTPLRPPFPEGYQRIVLATGCYWGAEKGFWRLPGVFSTAVGYAGGLVKNPTYQEACTGKTGHAEAVHVVWDPKVISTADILRWFWECHNPTQKDGQGGDTGTQYRSTVFTTSDAQLQLAKASLAAYEKTLAKATGEERKIYTEVKPLDEVGPFYYAHEGYQQYLARPGSRQYCSAEPQDVPLPPFEEWAPKDLADHAPKLGPSFWAKHAPKPHCVLRVPNEKLSYDGEP